MRRRSRAAGLFTADKPAYACLATRVPAGEPITAEKLRRVEGAEAAVDALADFIQECGLPTKLSQLKSKAEITPALLRQVADSTNLLPNGPRQLTHDEVYDILMECM